MSRRLALPIILTILIIVPLSASAQTGATPFDLHAAIASAAPGTVLTVPPGVYAGPFVVGKTLHLRGETGADGQRAVLDGGGQGTVLTITADGATVENFVVRNSGNVIDHEDGGIVVENADDVQILGNRLEDVLYGVRAVAANRLVVRDNIIRGRVQDTARRGDGLRFWQSEDGLVEGNTIEQVRDTIFWFSDGSTVRNNTFHHNRYGVHMMYSDGMKLVNNVLADNSVGVYLMYSINVDIEGNTFQNNRGPSGYGVAMKDMDEVSVRENYFIDNRVGLFFDNSPARIDGQQIIERNVLAYNDAGVLMMPAVKRNVLRHNSFVDNLDQVNVKGGGSQAGDQLGGNHWGGNFWSDYVGYDAAGTDTGAADGIGDLPYRAESLFENLADRHPNLKLFHFSPVEQAIDLAAKAFPVIKPKPKLTDDEPRMTPSLPATPAHTTPVPNNLGYAALAGGQHLTGSGALPGRPARRTHALLSRHTADPRGARCARPQPRRLLPADACRKDRPRDQGHRRAHHHLGAHPRAGGSSPLVPRCHRSLRRSSRREQPIFRWLRRPPA
ncbi:MAG: nitrous oxide reductase family maturation protein NosD [Caldilineaceae bacterium]